MNPISRIFSAATRWLHPANKPVIEATVPGNRNFTLPYETMDVLSQTLRRLPHDVLQSLMLDLYQRNQFCAELIIKNLDAIIGKTGIAVTYPKDTPALQEVLTAFWKANRLDQPTQIYALARDYIVTGELILPTRFLRDMFDLSQLGCRYVQQTGLDPKNYMHVIAVQQKVSLGLSDIFYKVVNAEEWRLSEDALRRREQMPQQCFYFGNFDDNAHPIPALGGVDWLRIQRRGMPYLTRSVDFLLELTRFLWTSLDQAQSWNTFNWDFTVTGDRDDVNYWREQIGTPKPNTALFHNQELMVKPVNFPARTAEVRGVYTMLRNAIASSISIPEYFLGEGGPVNYATSITMKSPIVQRQEVLQMAITGVFETILQAVADWAVQLKWVSPEERKRFTRDNGLTLVTQEVAKKDLSEGIGVYATTVQTFTGLVGLDLFTKESIQKGLQRLTRELLDIELEPKPLAELQAQAAQVSQAQALALKQQELAVKQQEEQTAGSPPPEQPSADVAA